MRCFYVRPLILVLAALLILQSGAGSLELCLCGGGGLEVQAVDERDCCSGEGAAESPEGISMPHGASCTDCIDIPLPGDGSEISVPHSVSLPERVSAALPIGIPTLGGLAFAPVPVSMEPLHSGLAHALSRTVVLRR